MSKIDRNIINNSKYIITYFNKNNVEITNLKLQKLLYFLEAIYIVVNDNENHLFEEDFYAWNFGPVNDVIYQEYKEFGSLPIEIQYVNIPEENKKYIEGLFDLLKDYTAYKLVALSHSEGSPWYEIYEKYQDTIIPDDIVIDKKKTKNWFKEIITIDENKI